MRDFPHVVVETSIGRFMVLFNGPDTLQVRAGGCYDGDTSPIEIRGNQYRVSNGYKLVDGEWTCPYKYLSNNKGFTHNDLPKTFDAKLMAGCLEAIRAALEAMPDGPKNAHIKVLEDEFNGLRGKLVDLRKAIGETETRMTEIERQLMLYCTND